VGTIDKTMKWLITGSNGQVGRIATELLISMNADVVTLSAKELDISDSQQVMSAIQFHRPNMIFNSAAWTNVDGAEVNSERAFEVNSLGPKNLALAAKSTNSRLIHLSTDYVFNGVSGSPFDEDNHFNPVNVYGESKSLGEKLIMEEFPEGSMVIRTAWLYSKYGNNFAKSILRKALVSEEDLMVVDDQFGQPTLASELVTKIYELSCSSWEPGTFHITNTGFTSWYEFAREIIESSDLDSSRVKPISTLFSGRLAKRPSFSVLSNSKLMKTGLHPMQAWDVAVHNSVGEIRKKVEEEIGI